MAGRIVQYIMSKPKNKTELQLKNEGYFYNTEKKMWGYYLDKSKVVKVDNEAYWEKQYSIKH